MTIQQFFRVDGGSTQLRGVSPDIAFPITADFDQNGEQINENALAWSSIRAANYAPTSDLKTIVPTLVQMHSERSSTDKAWQAFQADVADYRKLRKDTAISLNEQTRRAERAEQDQKCHERHPDRSCGDKTVASNDTGKKPVDTKIDKNQPATPDKDADTKPNAVAKSSSNKDGSSSSEDSRQDDGLQADERSLQAELAQEKKRKDEKDVVLQEAAHILSDEVDLIRNDTKIAARVLPHQALHVID
jgi:carboxyl-terminal processing protease